MNKFLSLLAFLFLLNVTAFSQSLITFKSMGHEDDAIVGQSGSSAYYLKVDRSVEMNGSKLTLFFQPSQALIPNLSYFNVLINDKMAFSTRLTKDSIQSVTLNLSRADISADKFLKIQVKTALVITEDKCKDLDNPAMWLKVKNFSYLELVKSNSNFFNNVNIGNCFESMKAIVYPSNPTLHDLKAVAWAYSRLKKADVKNIVVYENGHVPDSIRSYVMVGNMNHLPADKRALVKVVPGAGEGLFYLSKST